MLLEMTPCQTFTSISGSAVAMPISNLSNDRRGLVWRTSSATGTQNFIVDLGSAKPISTIALLRMNLRSTATIQIRAGTSAANTSSAPTYNSTALPAWASTTLRRDKPNSYHTIVGGAHTQRYWRFDISDNAHPDGYLEAARLVMGNTFSHVIGPSYGSSRGVKDYSVVRRNTVGFSNVSAGIRFPRASIKIDWLADANYEDWLALLESIGESNPVLINLDSGDAADEMAKQYFGQISNLRDMQYDAYNINSTSFDIISLM